TTARSFGDGSYWKAFRSSQPSRGAWGRLILSRRLKSALYAAQPAATAESASFAVTSTMTTCESGSGGSRTTIEPWVDIAQPAGTVKVAPAGVAFGVSL